MRSENGGRDELQLEFRRERGRFYDDSTHHRSTPNQSDSPARDCTCLGRVEGRQAFELLDRRADSLVSSLFEAIKSSSTSALKGFLYPSRDTRLTNSAEEEEEERTKEDAVEVSSIPSLSLSLSPAEPVGFYSLNPTKLPRREHLRIHHLELESRTRSRLDDLGDLEGLLLSDPTDVDRLFVEVIDTGWLRRIPAT